MILHWLLMKSMIFGSFGLWWPFLAFIGLFGLCGLGWFFKAKTGLCWWKLSTIDLFPTIRYQNQSPNEIKDFETVWKMHLILNFIAAWRRICWRMEPLVDFSLLSLPNATQEITLAAWGTHKHPLLSISWMVSFQKLNFIFQYQRTNLRRGRKTVRKEMWKWQMAVW